LDFLIEEYGDLLTEFAAALPDLEDDGKGFHRSLSASERRQTAAVCSIA